MNRKTACYGEIRNRRSLLLGLFQIWVCQRDTYSFHESNTPMGKGPHGGFPYATHYQISWHIYAFLKVFGVLRTFAIFAAGKFAPSASEEVSKKVLSRRRPFPSFPYKLQFANKKGMPSCNVSDVTRKKPRSSTVRT